MQFIPQILVRALVLGASAVLMACGQQGPLYLPQTGTIPRATLPESLLPASTQPAVAASAPSPQ